ncbi:MAG TPA: tetratricopeptide repeat protein [Candidatus Sulfotelmatobacter sp.]|nr:tetratricopeptide repeat protein [Candidatus Sulfotelmatobacter sp.]
MEAVSPDPATIDDLIEHDVERARNVIDEALARDPGSTAMVDARIRMLLRYSDMPMVVREAQRALSEQPTADRYSYFGIACLHLGHNREALTAFQAALKLTSSARMMDLIGRCHHRLGQLDAAIAAFRLVVSQPEAAGRWAWVTRRGLIYALRDRGLWEEADREANALLAEFRAKPVQVSSGVLEHDMQHVYHRWSVLLNKAQLARTLDAWHARHPEATRFWPESFVLPFDAARLAEFRARCPPGQIFIVKPVNLSGGQGMTVTREPTVAPGVTAVVQRYIDNPRLIDGRKFHLRIYVLITSLAPLRAYIYRQGIARITPEPYATDDAALARPAVHVTNTALHRNHPALVISQDPAREDDGNVWSLTAAFSRMASEGLEPQGVWARVAQLARGVLAVAADAGIFERQLREHTRYCFPPRLFGLDVLIDATGRPWLLEYQRNPAMGGNPLVMRINGQLCATIFQMSVYPLIDGDTSPAALADPAERSRIERAREQAAQALFMPIVG